jgi:hypothetical protein
VNRNAHLNDPLHVQRAQAAVAARNAIHARFLDVLRFGKDLRDFGSPVAMKSMICDYIFQPTVSGINTPSLNMIKKLSASLRRNEPLVLLELALWKAACMIHPPSPLSDPESYLLWINGGWKSHKTAMRSHAWTLIVSYVAPFLLPRTSEEAGTVS